MHYDAELPDMRYRFPWCVFCAFFVLWNLSDFLNVHVGRGRGHSHNLTRRQNIRNRLCTCACYDYKIEHMHRMTTVTCNFMSKQSPEQTNFSHDPLITKKAANGERRGSHCFRCQTVTRLKQSTPVLLEQW